MTSDRRGDLPAEWTAAARADSPQARELAVLLATHRIQVAADGYPLREMSGVFHAHPMDGRYVIDALWAQAAASSVNRAGTEIRRVAMAAVSRMERFGSALIFWYEPGQMAVGRLRHRRHYSALTQATYARALARAAALTQSGNLARAADGCFDSLLVPEPYGVLQRCNQGLYLAEVPMRPRDFTLNGWLTTLEAIHEYAALSGNPDAPPLLEANVGLLRKVIGLFDMPELANSRYSLTSAMRARIEFEPTSSRPIIRNLSITVPGEGPFPIRSGVGDRWLQQADPAYVEQTAGGLRPLRGVVMLNLVLSRIGQPAMHRVTLRVAPDTVHAARLLLFVGEYDPSTATPVRATWRVVATATPDADGTIALPIPWSSLDLVGYPTNFGKRVGADLVNSFHPIHVRRLASLADRLQADDLRQWALRWERAMQAWPSMPMYAGRKVLLGGEVHTVEALARSIPPDAGTETGGPW